MVPVVYGVGSIAMSYIENAKNPEMPTHYISGLIAIGLAVLFIGNPFNLFNILTEKIVKCFRNYKKINVEIVESASAINLVNGKGPN